MQFILYILSGLAITGTMLPLVDNEHWIIRGQAFFRAVYLVVNFILLIVMMTTVDTSALSLLMIMLLVLCIILCFRSIWTFTRFGQVQVKSNTQSDVTKQLSVLVYNVYQYNDKYQNFLELAARVQPDVIFLIETNTAWKNGLQALLEEYPYHFSDIRENTYGLMMFSKIEILEGGINYLVKPDIPSAEMLLKVNDSMIRVLGLHPRPPIPGESNSSKSKDRELVQAAIYLNKQIEDDFQILIGDLNDVAWSRASQGFKQKTGMQDPRAGRGFYSTFPTWLPIKIPLDHVFCSPEMEIVDFNILEDIGSDHYPLSVTFHLPEKCNFD